MEAQAIRESVHIANRRLDILLPDWIDNQDVEVIIFPKNPGVTLSKHNKRKPNLFAGNGTVRIADDFDAELPDSFWMGETE
jgi:hypothetical protein